MKVEFGQMIGTGMHFSEAASPLYECLDGVATDFHVSGHRLYIVGGVVRDLVLEVDADPYDVDLTTDAPPEVTKRILADHASALWTQGERFGTIGAKVADRAVEITTHRSEAYQSDSRKPVVAFGDSLEVDLSRRDFTINAMAISLPDGRFYDPFNGLSDCKSRRLRTPIEPAVSFQDDPLRMLRAARFTARFDLTVTPEVSLAARTTASRLSVVSQERINVELDRLLALDQPSRGFRFLIDNDLLSHAVPALAQLTAAEQQESCRLASGSGSLRSRRAGLFGPLFAAAGRRVVADALGQLRWSRTIALSTLTLLDHLAAVIVNEADEVAARSLLYRLDLLVTVDENWPTVLVDLGDLGRNVTMRSDQLPIYKVLAVMVADQGTVGFTPALDSHEVMELLSIDPGPIVGQVHEFMAEHWVQHGPVGAGEIAHEIKKWFACRP